MSHALYLYGFVAAGVRGPPDTLLGISGSVVELLDLGPVRAVVSSVPAEAFEPERVRERVHDLEWVSEQGALHERVVTWFVDHGGIVPVRLLTLYSGADALREAAAEQGEALPRQIERLRDLREWDLKVSFDRSVLAERLGDVSEDVARLELEIAQASPGRRYLLERKLARLVEEESVGAARRLAADLHETLCEASLEGRSFPLPRESGELPVVLNAAYLVPREHDADVSRVATEEARRLHSLGLEVRFTGPWAPYRFLDDPRPEEVDEGGEAAGA
jgi:hypothetical protein